MTPVKYAKYVRSISRTNTTTFPDADILDLTNIFKDEIAAEISKEVDEDYFGMRFYRDLEAGVRNYGLPDEILSRIKYVNAKLDGVNWVHLKEFDLTGYEQTTDEATIRAQFAGKKPAFDLWNREMKIFSADAIIAVTDGLELYAIVYPADITDLSGVIDMATDPTEYTHGFPRQFHELMARRVSIAYKTGKDKPIPLSEKEKLYEVDLARAIKNLKGGNLDRSVVGTVPRNTGQDY